MIDIRKKWPLLLPCLVALLTVQQTGMVSGWASPVLARLQSPNSPIPTTSDEGSWMATVMSAVGIFATPIAALSIEHLGRKLTILLCIVPFIISWIMLAVATSVSELIIGRGVGGVGLAFALSVVPIYLGEIATKEVRGGIGLLISVFVNIGILLMYCAGMHPALWFTSTIALLPLVFVILFYYWIPESPYFLMRKGRKEDARNILKQLRNEDNVDIEINRIETIVAEYAKVNMFKEFVSEPSHRRALFVSIGTISFAQFTGGIALVLYAHLIFQRASNISVNTLAIIKAVLQVLTTIGCAYVVDKLGRRPLLIISCVGSSIFMACEGVYFYLLDYGYNVDPIWWLPLFAMVMFNVSQVMGLTSIYIAQFGELFHPKVKALSVCISKAYLSLCIVVVGKLFQILTDSFGNCVPFFVFSAIGLVGVLFVVFVVPETKGRSLEEIQYYFKNKKYRDRSNTSNSTKM